MAGYCRWYDKDMKELTEHEQEKCKENRQDCCECPDLVIKNTQEE